MFISKSNLKKMYLDIAAREFMFLSRLIKGKSFREVFMLFHSREFVVGKLSYEPTFNVIDFGIISCSVIKSKKEEDKVSADLGIKESGCFLSRYITIRDKEDFIMYDDIDIVDYINTSCPRWYKSAISQSSNETCV